MDTDLESGGMVQTVFPAKIETNIDWYYVEDFVEKLRPQIYRSAGAIYWEIKCRGEALQKARVLVRGKGRRGHIVHRDFEKVSVELRLAELLQDD